MPTNRRTRSRLERLNRDPLADHLARGRINEAQYQAAQEFRKHYAAAEGDPSARQWLAKCHRELGQDGSALVHVMLIGGMAAKQVAASRGMKGQQWPLYYARRYFEALHTLAETMGFASEDRTAAR